MNCNFECKAFRAERLDEIVMLQFHDNFLLRTTDLSVRDQILDYLDFLSSQPEIKVLIIIGSPEKNACQEYAEFYRYVLASDLGIDAIHRMYNVINQLILKLVVSDLIVLHCNYGKVISSFLNISLACDYRIISADTVFQNPCLSLGLLPKGGGAFFLSRMVGLGKAYDILLSENDIPAQKALEIGIVDLVVNKGCLKDTAINKARQFSHQPKTSLAGAKQLLRHAFLKDLEDYLNFENQVAMKVVLSSDTWKTACVRQVQQNTMHGVGYWDFL